MRVKMGPNEQLLQPALDSLRRRRVELHTDWRLFRQSLDRARAADKAAFIRLGAHGVPAEMARRQRRAAMREAYQRLGTLNAVGREFGRTGTTIRICLAYQERAHERDARFGLQFSERAYKRLADAGIHSAAELRERAADPEFASKFSAQRDVGPEVLAEVIWALNGGRYEE